MNAYPAPPFDVVTFAGMAAITPVVALLAAKVFSGGQRKRQAGWLVAIATAMTLSAVLASTGLMARADVKPPWLQSLIGLEFVALLGYGLSRHGRIATNDTALGSLVLLQSFRLPLELVMLHAARRGVMPVEFSMAGYNFDVVTGALAVPLGLALLRGWAVPRYVLIAWNAWGVACLLVIAALAVATSPNVAWFGSAQAHVSVWVLYFPYAWLPTIVVPVAAYAHGLISLRLCLTNS